MPKKSTTQMTKAELLELTRRQADSIASLETRVRELEQQMQIRAQTLVLDQDTSNLVRVLRDRIKTLEEQVGNNL